MRQKYKFELFFFESDELNLKQLNFSIYIEGIGRFEGFGRH